MRYAFNETFAGEFTRSFKMVDPTLTANCAADLDALKASGALAEGFYDRALPLGCMVPDDIRDKIEEDGIDLSDVVVVGAARAGVGIDMYDYLLGQNATVLFVYGASPPTNNDTSKNFYWTFTPDVETAAQLVAAETCRRFGRGVEHRVLKLYGNDQPAFDIRVDAQLEWLWENCEAKITKTVEARANFDRDLACEPAKMGAMGVWTNFVWFAIS